MLSDSTNMTLSKRGNYVDGYQIVSSQTFGVEIASRSFLFCILILWCWLLKSIPMLKFIELFTKKLSPGTVLVVQWLGIRLAKQETRVRSLVMELRYHMWRRN